MQCSLWPLAGAKGWRKRFLSWKCCRVRPSQKQVCCVYLGTGIYLTFLEFRSVTSRYAAVIGGVTSETQTGKQVWIHSLWLWTNVFSELIYTIWTLTFGVDLLQGHLAGWKGSDHLIGWEQTDTVLLLGRAGPKPTSEEHVSPAVSALHLGEVKRPLKAVHLVRGLDKRRHQEESVTT